MSDLGTLSLGTYTNVASTTKTGADPVLEVIASSNDGSYASDATNSTHTGLATFTLQDVPADLSNVDTLAIRLRYLCAASLTNTWDALTARVFKSDGTTALTNLVTVASSITTTTGTNSSVISFTGVDTAATQADWNGAIVQIGWGISKVKGGDTVQKRVTAAEVTGTYTIATISGFSTVTVTDAVTVILGQLLVNAFDTVTVSELVTVKVSGSRLLIATGDYVIVQEGVIDQPKIVALQNVTVSEAYGIGGGLLITVFDAVLAQDSPAVQPLVLAVALNVFDNVRVNEGQTDENIVPVSVFDMVTVAELATINFNRLRVTVNDLLTVVDAPSVFAGGARGAIAADSVLVQEFQNLYLLIKINAFDAVQVIDGAWAPDVFDAVTVAENITVKLARLVIRTSDAVTVTESVNTFGPAIDVGAFTFDESVITESVTVRLHAIRPSVSDTVTVADTALVSLEGIDLSVSVSDSVSVTEALTVQPNPIQIYEFTELVVTESIRLFNTVLFINSLDTITVVDAITIRLSLVLLNVFDDVSVVERVAMRITSAGATGAQMRPLLPVIGAGH